MSTLHHIPQPTVRMRLSRTAVIVLVAVALALAAVVLALTVPDGGKQATAAGDGQSAPMSQTDPKYFVTHPALGAAGAGQGVVVGAKSETDPKYWVTHPAR